MGWKLVLVQVDSTVQIHYTFTTIFFTDIKALSMLRPQEVHLVAHKLKYLHTD